MLPAFGAPPKSISKYPAALLDVRSVSTRSARRVLCGDTRNSLVVPGTVLLKGRLAKLVPTFPPELVDRHNVVMAGYPSSRTFAGPNFSAGVSGVISAISGPRCNSSPIASCSAKGGS